MRRAFFLCVLMMALEATGLQAQSETGTEFNPYNLSDTIVVTANRVGTPIREISSSITVITTEQIERSQATMVSEVLRAVPGVTIVRPGGPGQQTSVFLRGANSQHTLVMIDGVKINDPSDPNGAVNLANLPVNNIERIEILRGPQSVLYGSDAIAGVIQIFTRQGSGRPTITISSEGGSFNTFHEQVAVSSNTEDIDYSVMLSRQDSDGISAASGETDNMERDGYGNTSLSASFRLRPSDRVQIRFVGRMIEADADLDQGFGVPDDPNYTMESKERSFAARITHDIREGSWSQQFGAQISHYKRSVTDFVDTHHAFVYSDARYDGKRVSFDWQQMLRLNEFVRLTAGVETENDQLDYSGDYSGWYAAVRDVSARTTGVYLMARGEVGDRWYSSVGMRQDKHEQFGSETTYRFTTTYLLDEFGLKLKATYGTGFKAPSLFQLYDLGTGNMDLKPEKSEGWEIGFEEQLGTGHAVFGATFFQTDFSDLIQFDGLTWKMDNLAEASSKGVELFAGANFDIVSMRLDYTYTSAEDESDGQQLLRRPEHKVSVQVDGEVVDRLNIAIKANYVGERADMDFSSWPASRVDLSDYTVVDLTVGYTLNPHLTLRGRIENLFDTDYEEVLGFGSIPISSYLGFSFTL